MELDKRELSELAARGKVRWTPLRTATLVGGCIGLVIPLLLAVVFSEQSWTWQVESYGVSRLLWKLAIPVTVSVLTFAAMSAAAVSLFRTRLAMPWRFTLAGGLTGSILASVVLGAAFSSELFGASSAYEIDSVDLVDDLLWLILGPGLNGAWVGAIAGLALWLTVTRKEIGPLLGAFGSSIFAAYVSAALTLLVGGMTSPPGTDERGAGIGPNAGHAISVVLVYLCGVLPVSIIAGSMFGWLRHRR